jgi:myo-inositol-1-phosphate synthase
LKNDIRIALAGIGNCASALVQGIEFYRKEKVRDGLVNAKIGKYTVNDLKFVAAFDIDERKVGRDLSEAIFAEPNNVRKIIQARQSNVQVHMAQPLDGISPIVRDKILLSKSKPVRISEILKEAEPDMLINLTPTGASKASTMFAQAALQAGCGYVNATPARIARDSILHKKFSQRKLTLVGDDIMDQIGSTIFHRNILAFLENRGLRIEDSYQLDIGGGTESQMALDKERYEIKRKIKTAAVAAAVPYSFPVVAGSSDFVDFMENRRTSYLNIQANYFAKTSLTLDMRMTYEDGPACAGTLIDVIRITRIAMDEKDSSLTDLASSYGFKAPPKRVDEQTLKQRITALTKGTKNI